MKYLILLLLVGSNCNSTTDPISANKITDSITVDYIDSVSVKLAWKKISGVDAYIVSISKNNTYTDFLDGYKEKEVTDTTLSISNLTKNTSYYYQFKTKKGTTTSDWSPSASIKTMSGMTDFTQAYVKQTPGKTFWWNDRVFYEIFVRSFKDSDGDGKGDFNGLTSKLDYLQSLGIKGIWLMPINPSPSYHGYDITDYYGINPDYGTMNDFKNFLNEAHKRDIKVIIDLVINHASTEHPWFKKGFNDKTAIERKYFVWETTKPTITPVIDANPFHGAPSDANASNGYYYAVFWSGMPDWNHTNADTKAEFRKIYTYWLNDINIDGFRVDAIKYLIETNNYTVLQNSPATYAYYTDARSYIKSIKTSLEPFWVGEAWGATDEVNSYTSKGSFDYCFEFDLAAAIIRAINNQKRDDIHGAINYISQKYGSAFYHQYGVFLSNHDQERVMTTLGINEGKMKLAATIYLLMPGIPYIYYGEEIGMVGAKPDEDLRLPMQWTSNRNGDFTTGTPWRNLNTNFTSYNVDTESKNSTSILNHYKKLIQLRNSDASLTAGDYQGLQSDNASIYSFIRTSNKNKGYLIIGNIGNTELLGMQVGTSESNLESGIYKLTDAFTNKTYTIRVSPNGKFTFYYNVKIASYGSGVFKIEKQ